MREPSSWLSLIAELTRARVSCMVTLTTATGYVAAAGELKTKPTQHSVRELMEIGIMPDVLICRAEHELGEDLRRKIALFCNVKSEAVIEASDVDTIYEVPLIFHAQNLDQLVVDNLGLSVPPPDLTAWRALVERVKRPTQGDVRIAVVGKYTDLVDSYKSIQQALIHGGIANDVRVRTDWLSSEEFNGPEDATRLADYDGLLVPGGFMPDKLRREQKVLDLVREFDAAGNLIAAICHGGWIPISAGVYRGVRVTGSLGIKDDLVNAGAIWEDAPVVVDQHHVSSRKPDDLPEFCRGMLQVLTQSEA